MITTQQALTANEFWHVHEKNADGTPVRARRTGKTQTWKTRPGDFSIPVKHGLRDSFRIQSFVTPGKQGRNDMDWCTPEMWKAGEPALLEGVQP